MPSIYTRAYLTAGYLEKMFAGVSGEMLVEACNIKLAW